MAKRLRAKTHVWNHEQNIRVGPSVEFTLEDEAAAQSLIDAGFAEYVVEGTSDPVAVAAEGSGTAVEPAQNSEFHPVFGEQQTQ